MEWCRKKRPMHRRQFTDLLCSPSDLSYPIHPPEFSAVVAAGTPSSKGGEPLREMPVNLPTGITSLPLGFFNMP
jgi:hypothetical protein